MSFRTFLNSGEGNFELDPGSGQINYTPWTSWTLFLIYVCIEANPARNVGSQHNCPPYQSKRNICKKENMKR